MARCRDSIRFVARPVDRTRPSTAIVASQPLWTGHSVQTMPSGELNGTCGCRRSGYSFGAAAFAASLDRKSVYRMTIGEATYAYVAP